MKNLVTLFTLAASVTLAGSASGDIIASWDIWGDQSTSGGYAADDTATGFTANINTTNFRRFHGNGQSDDNTFGSTLGSASTTPAIGLQFNNSNNDAVFNVNVTNSTGEAYVLNDLLFDFETSGSNTYQAYSVVFENISQSTTTAVLGSDSGLTVNSWFDVDIDASSITLADGEDGRFIVSLTDGGTGRSNSLDNVAVTGTIFTEPTSQVPEPGSLALFGLGLIGLVVFRRRRKR